MTPEQFEDARTLAAYWIMADDEKRRQMWSSDIKKICEALLADPAPQTSAECRCDGEQLIKGWHGTDCPKAIFCLCAPENNSIIAGCSIHDKPSASAETPKCGKCNDPEDKWFHKPENAGKEWCHPFEAEADKAPKTSKE